MHVTKNITPSIHYMSLHHCLCFYHVEAIYLQKTFVYVCATFSIVTPTWQRHTNGNFQNTFTWTLYEAFASIKERTSHQKQFTKTHLPVPPQTKAGTQSVVAQSCSQTDVAQPHTVKSYNKYNSATMWRNLACTPSTSRNLWVCAFIQTVYYWVSNHASCSNNLL